MLRHRPRCQSTPAGHALPAYRPALLVERRGGATGRLRDIRLVCRCLACLLATCRSSPRVNGRGDAAGISSRHRHLVRPCLLAYADGRRACADGSMRGRFSLLPRWSVSIVFKMLPCQCFKTMRLSGYPIRLGSPGSVNTDGVPVASPSPFAVPFRRFRFACLLRPTRRRPIPTTVAITRWLSIPHGVRPIRRPRSSRLSPRPPDTMNGAEATGRLAACPTGWRAERAVPPWLLVQCVPRVARRLAAFRIVAAALPFPHSAVARPFPSCPHSSIAPPVRHEERGAGRGGCLFGDDMRRMKKAGGCSFPVRLLWFYCAYMPW